MIGRLIRAPLVYLPDPPEMFRQRADRFEVLAAASDMAPYLRFLAEISRTQAALARSLPPTPPIPPEQVERARAGEMPPLDRAALPKSGALHETVTAFLSALEPVPLPGPAAGAMDLLRLAPRGDLESMLGNVVSDAIPFDALPPHLLLSAATQVHAARLASQLEAGALVRLQTGVCPVCGGPPVSSLVTGRQGAEGSRYAACAFCGTLWNEVRITCLACGTTKGVGYKHAGEDDNATVKAETCDTCRSWIKILYQDRNPALEPVADDVASLGLDLMMQETDYRRAGFDPFLIGY